MTKAIPFLTCNNAAEAIDFYVRALGATAGPVMKTPDGKVMHASIDIDGATVYLNDEFADHGVLGPKGIGGTPVTVHLQVDDAQTFWDRAVAAGVDVRMPLGMQFWGDKYGNFIDPYGHSWGIGQTVEVRTPEQIHEAMMAEGRQG